MRRRRGREEAAKSGTHSTIRWAHNDSGTQQQNDSGHKWHTTIVGTSGTQHSGEKVHNNKWAKIQLSGARLTSTRYKNQVGTQ